MNPDGDGNGDGNGDGESRHGGRKRRPIKPRTHRESPPPRPIDAAQLQDLAVGYAARFATTAAKLKRYLDRKLGERGWSGEALPDVEALVTRISGLGYVDDRAWAASKARDLAKRGFGARRVRGALAAAGVGRDDTGAALAAEEDTSLTTAIAFARRRRLGPFSRAGAAADPARMRRELAAMARAGHDFGTARRVLAAADEADITALLEQDE